MILPIFVFYLLAYHLAASDYFKSYRSLFGAASNEASNFLQLKMSVFLILFFCDVQVSWKHMMKDTVGL